jgi:hypothetical protein
MDDIRLHIMDLDQVNLSDLLSGRIPLEGQVNLSDQNQDDIAITAFNNFILTGKPDRSQA